MQRFWFEPRVGEKRATTSRRAAIAAILGALPGLPQPMTAGSRDEAAKGKRARRRRHKRNSRILRKRPCRPGLKEGKRCRCKKAGATCTNDAQCCPKTKGRMCRQGTCQPCDVCRTGCEFRSIQDAIDTLAPGATIRICPGTFGERLAIGSDVTLAGVGSEESGTTIDGLRGGTTLAIAGAKVTLERLRIVGGANLGAAGGGIRLQGGDVTLTECTVSGNSAEDGAGISVADGKLTLQESRVTGNRSTGSGGGIAAEKGSLGIRKSVVTGNEAAINGGGIAIEQCATTFFTSTVSGNEAGARGGGVYVDGGATSLFEGTRIERNRAAIEGGGIMRLAGAISLFDSTVAGNAPDNCAGNVGNCTNL